MDEAGLPDRSQILAALDAVADPKTGQGLAAAGLVRGLSIRGGRVGFMLEVPAAEIAAYGPVRDADRRLIPLTAWGVKVMSIGFSVEDGTANIWRGPMASSALRTLMNSVWGTADEPLDVLVIDLPPGTGDIQLTLVQRLQLD